MVYGSRFWAGLGRDADLALLQAALSAAPAPHAIAKRLLDLGGAECVAPIRWPPYNHMPPLGRPMYEGPHKQPHSALECTRSAARTLVGLATEQGWLAAVGPGRCCLPRHRMPFNSNNKGSK